MIKIHFTSSFKKKNEVRIEYEIEQHVVDTIVGNIMYHLEEQKDDSEVEINVDENHKFDCMIKINTQLVRCRQVATKLRKKHYYYWIVLNQRILPQIVLT